MYNIRYGTGNNRPCLPWSGYFRRTTDNMDRITAFLHQLHPDLVGLVEVDAGSYRSGRQNQAEQMARAMGHYHAYRSKYKKEGWLNTLPLFNKQGNAFVARDAIRNPQYHYFDQGVKRLVIELELENLTVFLVHLALGFRIRHGQLSDLYNLVKKTRKPHLVAGDFNSRWGEKEISLFLAATGLVNANRGGLSSFPSWAPRRHLDFVLHSPDIRVTGFSMPAVTYSDHLPLVCDFDIGRR